MTMAVIPAENPVLADKRRAPAGSNPAQRFTLDGDDGLERHLARTCETIRVEIENIVSARILEALVLGGGYGRGEGGVLKTKAGDRPYNDLEFYVFMRGSRIWNERKFGRVLDRLGARLSPEAGLHVEFKVDSLARLRRSPVTMFSYDLVSGHRVVAGKASPFRGCEHHLDAGGIPLAEATRLMMNRCSGLLFAREKLARERLSGDDADFVQRNLAKAQLAFGDTLLTAYGQYHWSCLERDERLRRFSPSETPSWFDEARQYHADGVNFKLHPCPATASRAMLESEHRNITEFALKVWLWLESRRLGCQFKSVRDYAFSRLNKCAGSNSCRNFLLNVMKFGPLAIFKTNCGRHPRETVLNLLALLLWGSIGPDIVFQDEIRNQFPMPLLTPADPVSAYQAIWRQLN